VFDAKKTEELQKYGKVKSGDKHGHVAYNDGTADDEDFE